MSAARKSSWVERLGEWGGWPTVCAHPREALPLSSSQVLTGFQNIQLFQEKSSISILCTIPEFDMLTVNLKNFKHTSMSPTHEIFPIHSHISLNVVLGKKRIINRIFVSRLAYSIWWTLKFQRHVNTAEKSHTSVHEHLWRGKCQFLIKL